MKDILQQLESVLRLGYSSHEIFTDWLDLMIYALMRDDEKYLEVVKKYKNAGKIGHREIDYFCNAFHLLLYLMKETNEEWLGEIYQQWNINNKYTGQFFTPKPIAGMMAKIVNPEGRILDPACGAGIMLVEAIKSMTHEQVEASVFYGQDIDLRCVKMCALNLLFFNVNGFVIWGDTIKMEVNKVYQTKRSYLGGAMRILSEEEMASFREKYQGALLKTKQETVYQSTKKEGEVSVSQETKNQLQLF